MDERSIVLQKIGAVDNPAIILTKVVSGAKFQHCLDLAILYTSKCLFAEAMRCCLD